VLKLLKLRPQLYFERLRGGADAGGVGGAWGGFAQRRGNLGTADGTNWSRDAGCDRCVTHFEVKNGLLSLMSVVFFIYYI
jgi:hypothetical protein